MGSEKVAWFRLAHFGWLTNLMLVYPLENLKVNCRLMKGWDRLVETKGRGRWWRNTTCTFEHKAPLSTQDPPTGSCVGISQLTSIDHACLHPLTFLFTSIPFFMSSSQKHVPHKSVSRHVVSLTLIIKASKAAGSDSLTQPLVLDPRTF